MPRKTPDAQIATADCDQGHQGQEPLARRGCALVGLLAKTYRYTSRQSGDAPIRHRLLELAQLRGDSGISACTSCCGPRA